MTDAPTEVIDAEVVGEEPTEPPMPPAPATHEIVRYGHGSTELVAGLTAADRVAAARDIATALNDVIVSQGLRTKVGSRKRLDPHTGDPAKDAQGREIWEPRWHVDVEGWQTLATLLGCAIIPRPPVAVVNPTTGHPIVRNFVVTEKAYHPKQQGGGLKHERTWTVEGHDWQVTVDIVKDGALIASGTGLCSRTETKWNSSDEFAVQSMAATRGASRAVANCARWIVALAGYSTTPSEEMPKGEQEPPPGPVIAEASAELKGTVRNVISYLLDGNEASVREVLTRLSEQFEARTPASAAQAIVLVGAAVKRYREQGVPARASDIPTDPSEPDGQMDLAGARETQ